MKIIIDWNPNPLEQNYTWTIYTGPDGIDVFTGGANTIGSCFEEISKVMALHALTYRDANQSLEDAVGSTIRYYYKQD